MDAQNETLHQADQFEFWIDFAQLEAQILLPEAFDATVVIAYAGIPDDYESHVFALAHELRGAGLATVLLDCIPDSHRMEDRHSGLRRYVPGLLRSRIVGALGRVSSRETLDSLPIGTLGLGACSAPALASAGPRAPTSDAVVAVGGRPGRATELADRLPADTLLLRSWSRLLEDESSEQRLKSMVTQTFAQVELESLHPPFPEEDQFARLSSLAKNWFRDHLVPSSPSAPDLETPVLSPDFPLPPSPAVDPERAPRQTFR